MDLDDVSKLVGLVIALFGVFTYVFDKYLARKKRTIEEVGDLLELYHEQYANLDINSHFQEHRRFLSKIEQFCIAVDSGVYSKRVLKKFGSKFLCFIYDHYEENVIAQRRKQYGEDNYRYLEKLINTYDHRRKDTHV